MQTALLFAGALERGKRTRAAPLVLVQRAADGQLAALVLALAATRAATAGTIKSSIAGLSRITVGRNLWTLNTGLSNVVGRGPLQGDLRNVQIDVGGSIGSMDIRGAIGINQDVATAPRPADAPGSVIIRTGRTATLKGDIGFIRLGSHMGFNTLILETSANSTVGGLLVNQDNTADTGIFTGIYGGGGLTGAQPIDLRLGPNSDLRFFDTPLLWVQGVPDVRQTLFPGVPITFVEESGARFTITLNPGPNGGGSGDIRVLPAQGGQGQIVGRIVVSLEDGASLSITSQLAPGQTQPNPRDIVSIGRIIITDATADSNITISGPIEVDVWRIDQTGGAAFNFISNTTPNGDIVVADMAALNQINVQGDLGRTQMPQGGPQLIGPFVGIARGQGGGGGGGGAAGTPIQLNGDNITGFWNGALFRPVNNANVQVGTASWLDDVGSPVDPFLNGLRARAGDIQNVSVGGSIGDVIATSGVIVNVIANSDRVTAPGRFDGIVGNIYANRINTVDIGDGLLGFTSSPFARASIVANDDINVVRGVLRGSNIEGLIVAANSTFNADPQTFPIDGINVVELPGGGSFVGAFIASMLLDDFWSSIYAPDDGQFRGRVQSVTTTGAPPLAGQPALPGNFFRSEIVAGVAGTLSIPGAFDAGRFQVALNADLIEAGEFRNSTIGGGELERALNQILSGGDLGIVRTRGDAGDISDLQITVQGGRVNQISASNIQRSNISANTTITTLRTVNSLRGSEIRSGSLPSVLIGRDLTASSIRAAGPIQLPSVTNNIVNSEIESTGPDGRIQTIRARSISGKILSSGPIDTIEATQGSIRAEIITLNSIRGIAGDIRLLRATGDLDITGDIGGRVTELSAGGNIGNPNGRGQLVLRGDTESILAPNGTLYLDLRSTAAIRQATFGSVPNIPGNSQVGRGSIVAFGRIDRVDITGDWGGNIISYSGGIGVVNIVNGSLLPGATVAAYSGDLLNLFITNGHLFGNVHADWNIFAIRLNGSADGVFGDIGINPALSSGVATSDPNRNQLPPGVIASGAIQGPSITAGWNIGRIILTNGSIFETFIFAGRALGTIDVTGWRS
ncbi:hypothetical protein J4558_07710 [Leptolyngbya sp. 15MV]|nr:hypothetical protein J4558_07710 [Leptolyngbya sp. 15MV]